VLEVLNVEGKDIRGGKSVSRSRIYVLIFGCQFNYQIQQLLLLICSKS
jgi:hypothetical protein